MNVIDKFDGKYHFLSNFYPCTIEYEGIVYPSTEHAYQAAKTTNPDLRQMIADIESPGKAKRRGWNLPLREDWDQVKFKVMYEINSYKFQDPDLRQKLRDTGKAELVEGNNWHDNFWGVCACKRCSGKGQNFLGRVLMEVRNDIRLTDLLHATLNKQSNNLFNEWGMIGNNPKDFDLEYRDEDYME